MKRFFFDVHTNGRATIDDEGTELASEEAVRMEAMRVLPAIAKDEVPQDGDRQAFVVMVRDAAGAPVYSATLTYAGLKLSAGNLLSPGD